MHFGDAVLAGDQGQSLLDLDILNGDRQIEFGTEPRHAVEQAQRAADARGTSDRPSPY